MIINENGNEREMTKAETTQWQKYVTDIENAQIVATQQAALRQQALAKLGLTAQELVALFG